MRYRLFAHAQDNRFTCTSSIFLLHCYRALSYIRLMYGCVITAIPSSCVLLQYILCSGHHPGSTKNADTDLDYCIQIHPQGIDL